MRTYEYALKDLFYHLHVGNITHRCQSVNQFGRLFRRHREAAGATIEFLGIAGMTLAEVAAVAAMQEEIVDEIELCANTAVANAAVLMPEEAEEMRNEEILTTAERRSLQKYKLCECYNVSPERITAEFVANYSKPAVMAQFSNLNRVHGAESIADSVKQWRESRAAKDTSVEDLPRSDNMLKCMFAVDVLDTLMPTAAGEADYTREVKSFKMRYVARADLEHRIDTAINMIKRNCDVVSLVFGLRRDRLNQERTDLKTKLELLNSIINGAYGVKLAGVKQARVATSMFRLGEPKMFAWNEQCGKYVVKAAKTN
eukprot:TRINITY_DN2411_c0_g1_i18.p2 TRINITY_DN2411_c0_g1~~TRINITY_DN2411_c0_g1_i18.p2  ORF type:complete len:314 (+),score=6.89 TRINITY_DN2411_c0_g1_i18:1052-1993(+)